jgi:hypothetical protein
MPRIVGFKHSEETKRKIGLGNKGKKSSLETRKKLSLSHIGKKYNLTPEIREKKRSIMLGNSYRLGKKLSEETKQKLSKVHMGYKATPETREKLRQTRLGKKMSEETKQKLRQINLGKKLPENVINKMKGRKQSQETIEKRRLKLIGRKMSKKTLEKLRLTNLGNKYSLGKQNALGYRHTLEAREKIALSATAEKSKNWQGGKSFEPYGIEFNHNLKKTIRARDNFTCQECGALENKRTHTCHHIDYDKNNNNPNNLITLCTQCHSKTTPLKRREYYIKKYQDKMARGICSI